MRRPRLARRAALVGACLLAPLGCAALEARPPAKASPAVRVLVPGGSDDFWHWALAPANLPAGLDLHVVTAGRPESAVTEALLVHAVEGTLPDLALVPPDAVTETGALARADLLQNLSREATVRALDPMVPRGDTWIPAGLRLPLVLVRAGEPAPAAGLATWDDILAFAERQAPDGVGLDPGSLEETFTWLSRVDADGGDGARLLLRRLHLAPNATRFWEKRWAPGTATFRRDRARVGIAATDALSDTTPAVRGTRAVPLPHSADVRYPAEVPAVWIVPQGTDLTRVRPVLDYVTSPAFAARVARYHGWAPVRSDAWDYLQDAIREIPAWGTVRDICTGPRAIRVVEPGAAGSEAERARAVGLWLADLPSEPEAALPERTGRLPLPRLTRTSSSERPSDPALLTLAQGETTLLPVPPLPPGHVPVAVDAIGSATSHAFPAQFSIQAPDHDELVPILRAPAGEHDGARVFADIAVPADVPPGRYELVLIDSADRDAPVSLGRITVTAAPHTLDPVPALCGLGLPEDSPHTAAVSRLLLEHGLTPFPLPLDSPLLAEPTRGPVVLRRWHDPSHAEADVEAADSAGVRRDLLEYSYDEPTLLHFAHLIKEAPLYRRLGLRVLVTHPPDPLLRGAAQVWGVHTSLRPTDTPSTADTWRRTLQGIRDANARGEEVWWYTAGDVAPLPNLQLGADLTRLRAAFFRLPALGFSGVLQAEAAAWGPQPRALPRGALGRGEGVLCFPGASPEAPAHPSLRLKALRDGVYTLRLLTALHRALVERAAALPNASDWAGYADERIAAYGRSMVDPAALALGDDVHPLMHLRTDTGHLQYVSGLLRTELEASLRGPQLFVRGNVPDWSVTTSGNLRLWGLVEPGASLSVDGVRVPVDADGTFTCRATLPSGFTRVSVVADHGSQRSGRTWHVWRTR